MPGSKCLDLIKDNFRCFRSHPKRSRCQRPTSEKKMHPDSEKFSAFPRTRLSLCTAIPKRTTYTHEWCSRNLLVSVNQVTGSNDDRQPALSLMDVFSNERVRKGSFDLDQRLFVLNCGTSAQGIFTLSDEDTPKIAQSRATILLGEKDWVPEVRW